MFELNAYETFSFSTRMLRNISTDDVKTLTSVNVANILMQISSLESAGEIH